MKYKIIFVPEKWINNKTKNMTTKLLFPILLLSAIAFADVAQAQQVGERLPMEQVYKRKYTATKIENFDHQVDGRDDEAEWDSVGEWSETFVQSQPVERGPASAHGGRR